MRQSTRLSSLLCAALGTGVLGATLAIDPLVLADEPNVDDTVATADDNPYLAPADLSTADLVGYVDKLRRRPESIRRRPGFGTALVEAAERVLADSKAAPEQLVAARMAQFDGLALVADGGDRAAAERLAKLADEHIGDEPSQIAGEARFHRLESLLLRGGPIDAGEVPKLLDEVEQYFTAERPVDRHERLAIAAIRLLRSLADADEVNRRSQALGNLLATSPSRKLARYGKRLSKDGATDEQTLTGQSLEIEGVTVDGLPFDWKAYRGRVVLVDFWATWCGPCKAELPHLKQAYDRLHDQGFDIVGISLDRDRAALEKFLAENPLGWPTLFHEGGQHPLAEKLGVRAIPFTLLIDRSGNIVAQNLHGPALVEHVERLLGDKP